MLAHEKLEVLKEVDARMQKVFMSLTASHEDSTGLVMAMELIATMEEETMKLAEREAEELTRHNAVDVDQRDEYAMSHNLD